MELWIRSQKNEKLRQGLFKVNEIELGDYDDDMNCLVANNLYCIGVYKSKERALEVLDEIQNILKPQLLVRRNDDNDKELLGALQKGVTQKLDMEFKELSTYVYEMPKE